ncbi:GYD domain-containing protein [Candidatus Methanoperedens nitratireducens]|uniref:GYD family protein n=1 Tax=Candidatus Methanoperedens nitratireducens TaxID=1392998 RepID=A0A284VMW1_9EURY|nr:GYD domain-containing protein [Candidatus Methanoperedens nitroreducens]SNQ60568.1 GYD family protein [Candidatus Methanoperedens nitroreducens]
MPKYIILFRFTPKGIEHIKESPARVEAAKQLFREMNAKVEEFYALMGRYDTIFIAEAPDDETIVKAVAAVGSLGNVQAETLRAFTEEEFRNLVEALP